jgi:hypothetical protein
MAHTAKWYAEYESAVAEFLEREGLSALSTGCDEHMTPEDEGGDVDPWFSWSPCECCGSHLGGNREYLFARDTNNDIVHFKVCEDCVYYVNYGRLDDSTMAEIEAA